MRKTLKWLLQTSKGKERKGKLKRNMGPSFSERKNEITDVRKEIDRPRTRTRTRVIGPRTGKKRGQVIFEEQMINTTSCKRQREVMKCYKINYVRIKQGVFFCKTLSEVS